MAEDELRESVVSNIRRHFSDSCAEEYLKTVDSNPFFTGASIDSLFAEIFCFCCAPTDEQITPLHLAEEDPDEFEAKRKSADKAYENRFRHLEYRDFSRLVSDLSQRLELFLADPVRFYEGLDGKAKRELHRKPDADGVVFWCVHWAVDQMPGSTRLDFDVILYRQYKRVLNALWESPYFQQRYKEATEQILSVLSSET